MTWRNARFCLGILPTPTSSASRSTQATSSLCIISAESPKSSPSSILICMARSCCTSSSRSDASRSQWRRILTWQHTHKIFTNIGTQLQQVSLSSLPRPNKLPFLQRPVPGKVRCNCEEKPRGTEMDGVQRDQGVFSLLPLTLSQAH